MSKISRDERQDMIRQMIEAGMSPEEADNFFQQGKIIEQKIIQIPGKKAARTIPLVARMGLISGVVIIKIGIERSRRDDFAALLEEIVGQEVVQALDFTGELEKRVKPFDVHSNIATLGDPIKEAN